MPSTLTRRSLIRAIAAVAAAGCGKRNVGRGEVVAVIGAGTSGLAAARDLRERGFEVFVLEARDRIGGRIWTDRSASPIDLGASWLHDAGENSVVPIAEFIGVEVHPTNYLSAAIYDENGSAVSDAESEAIDRMFSDFVADIAAYAETLDVDTSIRAAADAVLATAPWNTLDAESLRRLEHALHVWIEHEEGSPLEELSVWEGYDGIWEDPVPSDDRMVVSGYDRVVDHLAVGTDIRINQVVTRITHGENGIAITTETDAFVADRCVCTVPAGVLKAGFINFQPSLPAEKLAALDRTGVGTLNKVVLRFAERFWTDDAELFDVLDPEPGRFAETYDLAAVGGPSALMMFNAATFGVEIEAWTDAEIVAAAMAVLRRTWPDAADPVAVHITRWNADPYACGSYSNRRPGGTAEDARVLGEPVGDRLFFAGEATNPVNWATVHGAYDAGLRAARDVARAVR
jgi:monoamine oxidase